MDRILYMIMIFVLMIIMIISSNDNNTNLMILDGVALIMCQNNLLHIKDKE